MKNSFFSVWKDEDKIIFISIGNGTLSLPDNEFKTFRNLIRKGVFVKEKGSEFENLEMEE